MYIADICAMHYDVKRVFIQRTDVLPEDHVKSRSHVIPVKTFPITLKFDKHLDSVVVEMAVEFQNDAVIIASKPVAPGLDKNSW